MNRANPRAEDVIAYADQLWGSACSGCNAALLGHDAVLAMMLGFADAPMCAACVAGHLGQEVVPFLENARRNVSRLPCYRAGWEHSDARLAAAGPWPEERIPLRLRMVAPEAEVTKKPFRDPDNDPDNDPVHDAAQHASTLPPTDVDAALSAAPPADEWDAGDRGCGELALDLKLRLRRLEPGDRLLLLTTDLGAPADIPAWCRLTGNFLVAAGPPRFLIEKRSSPKGQSVPPRTPQP